MPSSLHVHRHLVRYRAMAGAHVTRVDGLVEQLGQLEPDPADGFWLIRRLDVRVSIAAGTPTRKAGQALARVVQRELSRTTRLGGPDVRWFPDRAAFVGQWLLDVGRGTTAGHWEYRQFGVAPASTAVRERAEVEPGVFLAALRGLPPAELEVVLARLAPPDAAAVVHAVADGSAPSDPLAVAAVIRALADAGRLPDDPRRATLAVVVALPGAVSTEAAEQARDLVAVVVSLRASAWLSRDALVAAFVAGDWPTAVRLGGSAAGTALAGWPANDRSAVLRVLAGSVATTAGPAREYTDLGGVFLLLPLLGELPLVDAADGWPTLGETPPAPVVALLAMLGVLGSDRTAAVLSDPWVRLALDLPALAAGDLAAWSRTLTPFHLQAFTATLQPWLDHRADAVPADLADDSLLLATLLDRPAALTLRRASSALLRELSFRLPGLATASAAHLRRNVLGLDARVVADDERIVVELGRAPLSLLLSLTGMNRRTFRLDATGDRPWVLTSAP